MENTKINNLLNELEQLKPNLHGKDFLLTWENSVDNLKAVMIVAEIIVLRKSVPTAPVAINAVEMADAATRSGTMIAINCKSGAASRHFSPSSQGTKSLATPAIAQRIPVVIASSKDRLL